MVVDTRKSAQLLETYGDVESFQAMLIDWMVEESSKGQMHRLYPVIEDVSINLPHESCSSISIFPGFIHGGNEFVPVPISAYLTRGRSLIGMKSMTLPSPGCVPNFDWIEICVMYVYVRACIPVSIYWCMYMHTMHGMVCMHMQHINHNIWIQN